MKDDIIDLMLLNNIRSNSNMYDLLLTCSHTQLISQIDHLFKLKYIEKTQLGDFIITEGGSQYWHRLNRKYAKRGLYKYLNPRLDVVNDQGLEINEIFVPLKMPKL